MDRLLTISEVADLLQVSRAQIYRLISEQGLPVATISGRRKRFRESDIENWVAGKVGAAS